MTIIATLRRTSRRRRITGAHHHNSLLLQRVAPTHFLPIRSFTLRFSPATIHHARRKPPLPAVLSAKAPQRPYSFLALRPFLLHYVLATRRKASLIDMGNCTSRRLGKSTNSGRNALRRSIDNASKITLEASQKDELQQDLSELFTPLKDEEESEVNNFFYGNGHSTKTIVVHTPSNIEITKEKLWCLRPRGWLNDEVINVYLALLKERAEREPNKFLKCHFFNTFFYGKLAGGKNGYDYQSVRRWTTHEKLGYGLVECDKIFVPIHRGMHWCLAVINRKDKTFHYLDSLGGMDFAVLRILARYIMDELKNKSDIEIDTSSWRESSDHVPSQQNGWDCGMFMLKFIDFQSRGLSLSFSQGDMEYFRKRTAKEILRLRAD